MAKWAFLMQQSYSYKQEGITIVDDLMDFDKDTIEQIAANLRRPAGRIWDPNPNAAPGATIPTPPYLGRSHKSDL